MMARCQSKSWPLLILFPMAFLAVISPVHPDNDAANRFGSPRNDLERFDGIYAAPADPEWEFFVAPAVYPSYVAK